MKIQVEMAWGSTLFLLLTAVALASAAYQIGVGIADVTGPSAEVTFMGYAKLEMKGKGIHLRQFSRAFIFDDGSERLVFVSVDAGMMGHMLRKEVIKRLQENYGDIYGENNVMLSGTHTHSGPGGFLQYMLFDVSILGFVQQTFDALAEGIVKSIDRAHNNMQNGRIYYGQGELLDANINRSPSAYLNNPEEERARYKYDVDKDMVLLKMTSEDGTPIGMINWFAVHPTSMNNTNRLVSSDNKGYASILFEGAMEPEALPGKTKFVAAFASTNLGDVSPNIKGPRCTNTGNPCDVLTSTCGGRTDLCVASGPGKDMWESTKIIAKRQFDKAWEIFNDPELTEVTGSLKVIHQYVDMPKQQVRYYNKRTRTWETVQGCSPAMGYSFAAGTTDGPGAFPFSQGSTTGNPLWNAVRNFLARPSDNMVDCQYPKPILLPTGEMNFPIEWQPTIVSTQVASLGNFVIAAVPGEFTTMSGRRLRDAIKEEIVNNGGSDDTKVVIAGLANTYTDYIVTPEEYQIQRYEGASTIYGPHTLTIHIQQYRQLTAALMAGRTLDPGPYPGEFLNDLISFVPGVVYDTAFGKEFGDCVLQPTPVAYPGDEVRARFVSGHPRNNLSLEASFLYVEKSQGGGWEVKFTDANWETKFIWHRINVILGTSEAEIVWDVPADVEPGTYRIRHAGSYKFIFGGIYPYQGISNTFEVKKINKSQRRFGKRKTRNGSSNPRNGSRPRS